MKAYQIEGWLEGKKIRQKYWREDFWWCFSSVLGQWRDQDNCPIVELYCLFSSDDWEEKVMNKAEKLQHCVGCENNFYNGNNSLGVLECWSLENAKLAMRKKVSMNQIPPWEQDPISVFSCRHETGYIFVEPDRKN